MKIRDIYWLAGLLEGEGCFSLDNPRRKTQAPRIELQMRDNDIMQRAVKLLGGNLYLSPPRPPRKAIYRTAIYCRKAVAWMLTLYPLMGSRRQAAIKRAVLHWRGRLEVPHATANR